MTLTEAQVERWRADIVNEIWGVDARAEINAIFDAALAQLRAREPVAWLDSEDFYDVCQAYRHAGDPFPKKEGLPSAAEAFQALKDHIRKHAAPQPAQGMVRVDGLTAPMLRAALEFIAPDATPDQDEDELSIGILTEHEDGPGIYVWMTEYPEEGSILLRALAAAQGGTK